jgi:hypothetical protein
MLTEKRYIEESVAADFSGRLRPSRDGDEGIRFGLRILKE